MEQHGSIAQQLRAAVESTRRLKGHPINRGTLQLWSEVIHEARARRAAGELFDDTEVARLIAELEVALATTVG